MSSPNGNVLRPVAVFGVVLALALVSCSSSPATNSPSGSTSETSQSTGSWTFVDDRHATVTLDAMPQRIIAHEDAAVALLDFGIRPIAIFGSAPLAENPALKGLDLTGIESVGDAYGEIDLERMAALGPDLVVTELYPNALNGFKDAHQQSIVEKIAPLLALSATDPASRVIERYSELASSLGVDLESSDIAAKRDAYEQAFSDLRTAVKDRPNISVLAVSTDDSYLYVATPLNLADLKDYLALGMNIVIPKSLDDGYYEYLSWENAGKYPADVILYDARVFALTPAQLSKKPTWGSMPAVKAGQLVPWYIRGGQSYTQNTQDIQALAQAIDNAQDVA